MELTAATRKLRRPCRIPYGTTALSIRVRTCIYMEIQRLCPWHRCVGPRGTPVPAVLPIVRARVSTHLDALERAKSAEGGRAPGRVQWRCLGLRHELRWGPLRRVAGGSRGKGCLTGPIRAACRGAGCLLVLRGSPFNERPATELEAAKQSRARVLLSRTAAPILPCRVGSQVSAARAGYCSGASMLSCSHASWVP